MGTGVGGEWVGCTGAIIGVDGDPHEERIKESRSRMAKKRRSVDKDSIPKEELKGDSHSLCESDCHLVVLAFDRAGCKTRYDLALGKQIEDDGRQGR